MNDDSRGVRPDPCTLMFEVRPRGSSEDDRAVAGRGLDLWIDQARRAGWNVVPEPVLAQTAADCIGTVAIEGVRYSVHLGPRKRMAVIDPRSGVPVHRVVLERSVWVEPLVTDELLASYP